MKFLQLTLVWTFLIGILIAAPVSLPLKDGSIIKGEVNSASPTEVVVSTEFGVVRVPSSKLTDEAKRAAGIDKPATTIQYEARINALEARIQTLEAENAQLRKQATAERTVAPSRTAVQPASLAPTSPKPPAASQGYSLSSTGKRHSAGCRYFGSGRPCGPNDGVACKICGG